MSTDRDLNRSGFLLTVWKVYGLSLRHCIIAIWLLGQTWHISHQFKYWQNKIASVYIHPDTCIQNYAQPANYLVENNLSNKSQVKKRCLSGKDARPWLKTLRGSSY